MEREGIREDKKRVVYLEDSPENWFGYGGEKNAMR